MLLLILLSCFEIKDQISSTQPTAADYHPLRPGIAIPTSEFIYNNQNCKVISIYTISDAYYELGTPKAKFIDCEGQLINSSYNYSKGKFGI